MRMCLENNWSATMTALSEDGYDPNIDWVRMYEKWKADADE